MNDLPTYKYRSLTSAIDTASPLREYFNGQFPYLKEVQSAYQTPPRPLLVEGGAGNPGTIGAAFDFVVRMVLDPTYTADLALMGFSRAPEQIAVMRQVVEVAQQAAGCRDGEAPEELLRACWALALRVEVYRTGAVAPGSPLAPLMARGTFSPSDLLAIASDEVVGELGRLHAVVCAHLYPAMPYPAQRIAIGPTFAASRLCAADADLIVDGLLLEVKTHQGRKNKTTGARTDSVSLPDIYQLLGYVLFDHSDEYAIDSVGYYSGRYGSLTTWPLDAFLDSLAGRPVDVAAAREQVWDLLSRGQTSALRAR